MLKNGCALLVAGEEKEFGELSTDHYPLMARIIMQYEDMMDVAHIYLAMLRIVLRRAPDWHRGEVIATVIRELNKMRGTADDFDDTPFAG